MMQLGTAGVEQLAARIDGRVARDRADLAVRVLGGVVLAFLGAGLRRAGANFELHRDHAEIGRGLTGQHACGGATDVGAIEIEPDAMHERLDAVLGETRIGARAAHLRAVEQHVGMLDEVGAELGVRRGMRLRHAFDEMLHD